MLLYSRRHWPSQPLDTFELAEDIRPYASSFFVGNAMGRTGDGRPITLAGGITLGGSPHGLAYQGDGTDNIAYATPARNFVFGTDKDFTFICVARKRSASLDSNHIGGFGATGGGSGNTLFRVIGGGASANAIRIQAQDTDGDVFFNTDSSDFGFSDLAWHAFVVKGRVANVSTDAGTSAFFADGKAAGTAAGLSATTPNATTFNAISVCGARRGGSTITLGPYDVALFVPLVGIQMPDAWCKAASSLTDVWGMCFAPTSEWMSLPSAGAGITGPLIGGHLINRGPLIGGRLVA